MRAVEEQCKRAEGEADSNSALVHLVAVDTIEKSRCSLAGLSEVLAG